ncbi:Oidioi.mRNA.OKI2018_I69.PAR.g9116.t1.cds [Oikopleura dioica]|uniref:Oidioi.mRNA.OKI2018_I69.PAR.g9116.t1.cds n=1 Tax=Oikopleura dioica TaxID=34765 RepID=A0ABN7RLP2_OIKDI|nr:Oidioi.mRNA.OKI2018_I69.PAR.g9116.t1.cds [Oikopleura dioica]
MPGSARSLECVRCNSYIDVENSHCWSPNHDLLVSCPDRLDGTKPMCLTEIRVMRTRKNLELVDLRRECYYGFEPEVSIVRQDICRENFCNTFSLPKKSEDMFSVEMSYESQKRQKEPLSCISCSGKDTCLNPTLRMRTSSTENCEAYYDWPGCFLESWMNDDGELSSIRRGCYDFSQKPGESFTEFIQTKTCDENKCNNDQPDFKKKFSTDFEGSGDDDQNDDEEIDDTFFDGIFSTIHSTEKDLDDSITTVVTIGTEKYETASGDGEEDYFSGSGDGEEKDSVFIPEIISVAQQWTEKTQKTTTVTVASTEVFEPEIVDPKKNIKDEKGPKPSPAEEITVYIGYGEPVSEEITSKKTSAASRLGIPSVLFVASMFLL